MKKTRLLISLIFISMSSLQLNNVVYAAKQSFSDSTVEYFFVKEIIEVTSDWLDIIWNQGLDVHTVRYSILEGEEAIKNIRVSGLTVAIDQSLDTKKIVVEIEAIVNKNADTALVEIKKGAIGYANVEIQVYDVTQEEFFRVASGGTQRENKVLQFNLDTLFAYPAGNMSLTENLKDLKGKVFAFYYPWYASPNGPSPNWDHWREVTENSIFDSTNYPLHGAYDSNDVNIIRSHMAVIKQAGIDGIIVSWWGAEGMEAFPLDEIFDVASEFGIEVSLYYESVRDLTQQEVIDEFLYIFETYPDNHVFMKNEGIPVVFVYALDAKQRSPEFWKGVRDSVQSQYGEHIMIGDTSDIGYLNVFDGFHMYILLDERYPEFFEESINKLEIGASTLEEDIIFQKAMDNEDIEFTVKPFMTTVCPSFDARSWGSMEPLVERLDGDTYRNYWEVSLELEPHSVLITSWNEWHEGTEMEPSKEYGFRYIQMTKEYIEEYKGVTIPIDDVLYSAFLGEFTHSSTGTGSGDIQIDAQQGHVLYVNVTVEWGTDIQSAEIECEPYIYLRKIRDNTHSIIIPSAPSGEGLDVQVNYGTDEEQPKLRVSITAYDQAGNYYELLDNIVSSSRIIEMMPTNIIIETEEETLSIEDTVQVTGSIDPIVSNIVINIDYSKPDGTQVTKNARTDSTGMFTSKLQLLDAGTWSIQGSWQGNEEFTGSESQRITINVEAERDTKETIKPIIPGYPVEAILLVLMLFIVYPRITQKPESTRAQPLG